MKNIGPIEIFEDMALIRRTGFYLLRGKFNGCVLHDLCYAGVLYFIYVFVGMLLYFG